jgi:hypothetical protein
MIRGRRYRSADGFTPCRADSTARCQVIAGAAVK